VTTDSITKLSGSITSINTLGEGLVLINTLHVLGLLQMVATISIAGELHNNSLRTAIGAKQLSIVSIHMTKMIIEAEQKVSTFFFKIFFEYFFLFPLA
jgi:hypothetical protein